jgi:enhancing lycopene biosynthesis protein 2
MERELSRLTPVKIESVKATEIDALIIPGGIRLFRELCNYEAAGDSMKVDDRLKTLLKGIYRLEKPIGAFGPAVLLLTKALQGITTSGPVVTVGNDPRLQAGIEKSGAQSVITRPGEVVLDETNKLVTSGGELGTKRVSEVNAACENLLSGLTELMIDRM